MASTAFGDPGQSAAQAPTAQNDSGHSQTETLHSRHGGASRAENTLQAPIGDDTAEINAQQESMPARPPQREEALDSPNSTTISNRIRSWADAGSRTQAKGKLGLKKIGNIIKEPGRTIESKFTKVLGKEHSLRNRLSMASVTSHHPDNHRERFLPIEDLRKLLEVDVVERQLVKCNRRQRPPGKLLTGRNGTASTSESRPDIKATAREICGTRPEDVKGKVSDGKSYLKIFAILILIKRRPMILAFMKAGVCDNDLPLALIDTDRSTPWKLQRKDGHDIPPQGFKDWKKRSFMRFEEKQWVVLAPCFNHQCDKREDPQHLLNKHILPFTSWDKMATTQSGKVYKVHIHSGHHTFSNPPVAFALKKVYKSNEINPKNELSILRKFKNDRHKHLISLLASYIQHDAYHLIFPWAEADLLGYWKKVNPSPAESSRAQNLVWLAEQCQGLAEGLAFIHRYETSSFKSLLHPCSFPPRACSLVQTDSEKEVRRLFGRHGDIKPENILWFPGCGPSNGSHGGTLKISDFGIAEFSTRPEVQWKRRGCIPCSRTYRAPETDLLADDGVLSASYDIWALGCVYLEFITWWLGGWSYIDEFTQWRLDSDVGHYGQTSDHFRSDVFFSVTQIKGEQEAHVKKKVTEFMGELQKNSRSDRFIREFINLIKKRMLVVLPQLEEDGSPGTGRRSSKNVAGDLEEMQEKYLPQKPYQGQD
ncbi:hypothetical protein ACJZ2D_000789 [Fusarium nematophilum]